jgi:hypothetical protein
VTERDRVGAGAVAVSARNRRENVIDGGGNEDERFGLVIDARISRGRGDLGRWAAVVAAERTDRAFADWSNRDRMARRACRDGCRCEEQQAQEVWGKPEEGPERDHAAHAFMPPMRRRRKCA